MLNVYSFNTKISRSNSLKSTRKTTYFSLSTKFSFGHKIVRTFGAYVSFRNSTFAIKFQIYNNKAANSGLRAVDKVNKSGPKLRVTKHCAVCAEFASS